MNSEFCPVTLKGDYCTLEPLTLKHCDALIIAMQDGKLWRSPYAMISDPAHLHQRVIEQLECQKQQTMLPFAVIDNTTSKAIGMTTYCNIDVKNKRLDIGWTWYASASQRTGVNTESKLLLLTHAFEKLGCIYAGFRVDYLNTQSRTAVERLGAKLDGIIRNYAILPNGSIRDMCFYSILPNEWPAVKTHLSWLLEKER